MNMKVLAWIDENVRPELLWAIFGSIAAAVWFESLAAGFCWFWTLAVFRGHRGW